MPEAAASRAVGAPSPTALPRRHVRRPAKQAGKRELPRDAQPETRLTVAELAASWRSALGAAESALRAAGGSLSDAEVAFGLRRLAAERAAPLELLEAVARQHPSAPQPRRRARSSSPGAA